MSIHEWITLGIAASIMAVILTVLWKMSTYNPPDRLKR